MLTFLRVTRCNASTTGVPVATITDQNHLRCEFLTVVDPVDELRVGDGKLFGKYATAQVAQRWQAHAWENSLSAFLKQHMAISRVMFDHLVPGARSSTARPRVKTASSAHALRDFPRRAPRTLRSARGPRRP